MAGADAAMAAGVVAIDKVEPPSAFPFRMASTSEPPARAHSTAGGQQPCPCPFVSPFGAVHAAGGGLAVLCRVLLAGRCLLGLRLYLLQYCLLYVLLQCLDMAMACVLGFTMGRHQVRAVRTKCSRSNSAAGGAPAAQSVSMVDPQWLF